MNVTHQYMCLRSKDKSAEKTQYFVSGEIVVGWNIIHQAGIEVNAFELYHDTQVKIEQL